MTGFFTDVRGYFNVKYSGRYLSRILCELARHEPESFALIFGLAASKLGPEQAGVLKSLSRQLCNKGGVVEAECETSFPGSVSGRRADLTLLKEREPMVFFEVKEDDVKNPRNSDQLDDYLKQAAKGIPFIHLSRYSLEPSELKKIQRAAKRNPVVSLRYREIYKALFREGGPVSCMVCEYLEDLGMASYKSINLESSTLKWGVAQMLGFPHAHGLGKINSLETVTQFPAMLQSIAGNLEFLGETVKDENDEIRKVFSRGFRPRPYYNIKKLKKELKNIEEKDAWLDNKGVTGGCVDFWAHGAVGLPPKPRSRAPCSVEIGYTFELNKGDKEVPTGLTFWTCFLGQVGSAELKWKDTIKECKCKTFPKEEKALRLLHDCLEESKQKALPQAKGSIKKAIKNFNPTRLP